METRWFSPFDGSLVSLRLHPQNSGRRTTQDELSREVYGFGGPLCPDDRLKSLVEKETYFTMMLQSLPSEFSGPYILQAPWLSLACFSSIFCSFFLSLACRIRSAVYTDQRAGNLNWANDVNVMWRNLLPPTKKASILECPKFSLQISGDLGVWKSMMIHAYPCIAESPNIQGPNLWTSSWLASCRPSFWAENWFDGIEFLMSGFLFFAHAS